MFNMFKSQKPDHYISVHTEDDYATGDNVLRSIYEAKLLPLEEHYFFNHFHMARLEDSDFASSAMLLISGDTMAKRRLLMEITNVDISTIQNSSEETHDECFKAIIYGEEECTISASILLSDSTKPLHPLQDLGLNFYNHFQGISVRSTLLKNMTIIDTPSILKNDTTVIASCVSDCVDSQYDLTTAFDWFCQRADRILLLFDAENVTISDTHRRSIEMYSQKVVIVLDNTDICQQTLMKVYGTLMFTLATIVKSSTDITRVYVGPLSDHTHHPINGRLFHDERRDFFRDLRSLIASASYGQLNRLLVRARLAKVHAYIMSELHNEMRSVLIKERKKLQLCQQLQNIFDKVRRDRNISCEDFPDIKKMQIALQKFDFNKLNSLKPELVDLFDDQAVHGITQYINRISFVH